MASSGTQTWQAAQKLRRVVLREVEQLKSDSSDGNEMAHFEKIDTLMSNYRLACVQTLFGDIRFASQEKVDAVLWQTHAFVNDRYRKVLARLKSPQQAVLRRKIEKMYNNFLKVSQYFYKGFIQRLCARYKIPRLEHIARAMDLEPLSMRPDELVDAVADGIDGLVLASCHLKLIYLGDLSRYRGQARQKSQGSETALRYYGLANDLVPASGYGHHQMGVIFLDEKKHFEIVYHFFRAWAAEKPHPNSSNNLDLEFRELLRPATPRSHGPHDALRSWFVRLHAFFSQGRPFAQHAELEQEVIHRFEVALKSQAMDETLLQMVLINACAYQYAQDKVHTKWTETGSRACQFIVQLNVRMILTLARIIKSELADLDKHPISGQQQIDRPVEQAGESGYELVKSSPTISSCLPLLRVFIYWLTIHRADVVGYAPHIPAHLEEMYRALSQALTSLLEVYGGTELASAPYLLSEDLELQGMRVFEAAELPPALKLLCDDDGQKKPRVNDPAHAVSANSEGELLGRVLDILKCGFFLAGDASFPFAVESVQRDGRRITSVRHVDVNEAQQEQLPKDATGRHVFESPDEIGVQGAVAVLSLDSTPGGEIDGERSRPSTSSAAYHYDSGPGRPSTATSGPHDIAAAAHGGSFWGMEDDQNFDFDEARVLNMVNDFLAPPEAKKGKHENDFFREDTSYGMHTSTTNEIFDAVAAPAVVKPTSPSPGPNSATGRRFPSLPWDYFYTPTPPQQRLGQQQQSAMESSRHRTELGSAHLPGSMSSGSTGPGIGIQGVDQLDDPFALGNDVRRYNNIMVSAPDGSAAAWAEAEQWRLSGKGLVYKEEATKGIYGGYPGQAWPPQPQDWNTPRAGQMVSPEANPYPVGHAPTHQANPLAAPFRPFGSSINPSTTFSSNESSLPPVNSPWGLPDAQLMPASTQPTDAVTLPASTSGGSIHSGSTLNPGLTYNGVIYNATTAYGRGTIATKDDPTHFKNTVKSSGLAEVVAEADEYDRKVLASAFADDYTPRR